MSTVAELQTGLILDLCNALIQAHASTQRLILEVLTRLDNLSDKETTTVATIQQLQEQVTKSDDVMQSAVTLIAGFSQQLKDARAQEDPGPALDKVIADLDQRTEALAQAVVANTPVAPAASATQAGVGGGTPVPTSGEINQPVPTGPAPGGLPPAGQNTQEMPPSPADTGSAASSQPQDQAAQPQDQAAQGQQEAAPAQASNALASRNTSG